MKYEKNRKILGMDEVKLQKMGRILIIPAVVIVLVIVILIADRKPGNDQADAAAPSQNKESLKETMANVDPADPDGTVAATGDSSFNEADYINSFDNYGLQQNAVTAVNEIVAKYQRAKTTGDAKLLYEVFNREKDDDFEDMSARLKDEMEVYESYDHTTCYTTAGCEEDSYLVYIASDLKFAGIDTPAPMLTWAYVYKAEDGNYYMKEPDKLNEEEEALLDEVSASEDVKLLDTDMRQRLAQAVVSDAKLGALYQMWSDTADSEGQTAEETKEAEIRIGDTAASDEGAESEIKIGADE